MLQRAESGQPLPDHELLEIILFNPIPRKNTNEIAHRLLAAYGTLTGVFAAGEEELEKVEGVGKSTAQYIRCVAELFDRMRAERTPVPKAFSFVNFSSFIDERFRGLREEVVDFFCLDGADHIKHTARFTSGESQRVEVSIDDVNRLLISQHPRGIVVAHNHPNAPSLPSGQDDEFTAQLQILCSLSKVKLRDHIIVGTDGMFSYFTHGRLEEIETAYSVENIINAKSIL